MLHKETYKVNPCRESSLPYWKGKTFKLPEDMKVIHDEEFNDELLGIYNDNQYFRLLHSMDNINYELLDGYYIKTAKLDDINIIIDVINESYTDISVTKEQMYSYTQTQV